MNLETIEKKQAALAKAKEAELAKFENRRIFGKFRLYRSSSDRKWRATAAAKGEFVCIYVGKDPRAAGAKIVEYMARNPGRKKIFMEANK